MLIKVCICSIVILTTGSSFVMARLFSSHQYPPPDTTAIYRRLPLRHYFAPSSLVTQYDSLYHPSVYQHIDGNYQPMASSRHLYSKNNQPHSSEDFMSILELAARQKYNPGSLSLPATQQQQKHSGYSPYAQTKQHHHSYRPALANSQQNADDQLPQYQHQLEPIVYEVDHELPQTTTSSQYVNWPIGESEKSSAEMPQIPTGGLDIYRLLAAAQLKSKSLLNY